MYERQVKAMIYNKFQSLELSALGMGCMRFPTLEDGSINKEATREMFAYAMEKGINYYDTAWVYHNSQSEPVVGELLSEYPRDSFYLATKFPGFDLANINKVEEIFEAQLERCRVEYFDFYLFHNVCEADIEQYLDPQYRIYDYLMAQKKNGRIRHLGFSAHANMENLKRFLDAYGKDMEFCQLQINWLDWEYQNAKEKVELVSLYGIPVWVMEPVRGGKLVKLSPRYEEKLKAFRPNATNAEWAFRFIQSIPQVAVTLSGMSNFDQLKENIATFEQAKPVNEAERQLLLSMGRAMANKNTLPCTACEYCTTHCPMELNVPHLIELYNEQAYTVTPEAVSSISNEKLPSACIGCRACEAVCPQGIKISEMMSDFAEKIK